jgi:hypothetical protein
MKTGEQEKGCAEIAPLLVFYVCDEVDDQERAAIERHVEECAACQAQLAAELEFQSAIGSLRGEKEKLDTAGILLARCRSELAEKLDDLEHPPVKEKVLPSSWLRGWMALHPVWSAGTLVLLGLVAGIQYSQRFGVRNDAVTAEQAVDVHPGPRLTEDQLSKMAVSGISFTPSSDSGSKNVRVRLSAEQPVELDGNLDDSDVRNVLTYVVKNGERFDSGVRLDCLDVLKARAEDAQVRVALLCAARRDQNPAVRLKALEALRNVSVDGEVRQALLEALQRDSNPGVRVEAVNLLVRSLGAAQHQSVTPFLPAPTQRTVGGPLIQAGTHMGSADGSVESAIRTLEELQRNDPSRYVRLRSAAALREINARGDQ